MKVHIFGVQIDKSNLCQKCTFPDTPGWLNTIFPGKASSATLMLEMVSFHVRGMNGNGDEGGAFIGTAEGSHSRSASYHTYKDLKCAYPRRVQPHKAPGGALPCCWGTCCTAQTLLQDYNKSKQGKKQQFINA